MKGLVCCLCTHSGSCAAGNDHHPDHRSAGRWDFPQLQTDWLLHPQHAQTPQVGHTRTAPRTCHAFCHGPRQCLICHPCKAGYSTAVEHLTSDEEATGLTQLHVMDVLHEHITATR